jgi:hypothetical protein
MFNKRSNDSSENSRISKDQAVENLLPVEAVESLPPLNPSTLDNLIMQVIPKEELEETLKLLSERLLQIEEKRKEFEEQGKKLATRWLEIQDKISPSLKALPSFISRIEGGGNLEKPKMQELLVALKKPNSTISSLDLSCNQLREPAIYCLADSLGVNTSLTHLNLERTGTTDFGAYCLAKALAKNSSLLTLDVYCNPLTSIGWYFLCCALAVNTTLQKLILKGSQDVNVNFIKAFYLSAAILANFQNKGVLQVLNLNSTALGDKGAMALALALKENPLVLYLDVGACSITSLGVEKISEALRSNPTLTSVFMQNQPLGAAVEMLFSFGALSKLNLEKTGLDDQAIYAFSPHLQNNTNLIYLNLGANPFTKKYNDPRILDHQNKKK